MTSSPPPPELPHEEIRPDELLMRRVLPRKKDFRATLTPPIQEGAFWPGPNDHDGLSLSRRRSEVFGHFLSEWQFKAACTHPDQNLRERCGVCAILAGAAQAIGLEVRPDPIIPDDPGHVLLPQITYQEFQESAEGRQRILVWIGQLIELASQRILIAPGTSSPPAT